jgi:ATP-dependent helicase/nuclease subunit A
LERIVGRIDRLISGPPIRIIDFKSDAVPPAQGSPVPPAYLTQLALYREGLRKIFPGQVVEAAILWTESGDLARIDPETLDAAARPFTMP